MKKVYAVIGSEDGLMAIYGSRRNAEARAAEYCRDEEGDHVEEERSEYRTEYTGKRNYAEVEVFCLE